MSPRAKGQPVFPKTKPFCLECIAIGFHRADCPVAKKLAKKPSRMTRLPPPATDSDSDEENDG